MEDVLNGCAEFLLVTAAAAIDPNAMEFAAVEQAKIVVTYRPQDAPVIDMAADFRSGSPSLAG